MRSSTLTTKGQTTIPKEIRELLHLHVGDRIDFIVESDDRVTLRPSTLDIRHLKGLLKRKDGKKVSLEQMNKAIVEGVIGRSK
jgi:antitoxin PrlF